jgi:acyl-CoA thioester hydrolase
MRARLSPENLKPNASVSLEIPFHDVDSINIVWHGHYMKYFECARTALFQKIGHDIPEMLASGYGYPVVDLQAKYIKPLKYGQKIKVIAAIAEYEHKLKVLYTIHDATTGELVATGHTIQYVIDINTGLTLIETPVILREHILRATKE